MLVLLLAATARAEPPSRVLFDEPSPFARVLVVESGAVRTLHFDDPNGAIQSAMRLDRPEVPELEYVRHALVGLAFVGEAPRVLMIGLGGGSFSGFVHRHLPRARVTSVELDPVVVRAAKRHFGVVEDARHRIVTGDGRAFLASSDEAYDLVFVDAYSGEGIPEALKGPAFHRLVQRHVRLAGVAVFNLALESEAEERRFVDDVGATFGRLVCLRTPDGGNLIVIAGRGAPPRRRVLVERAEALTRARALPVELAPLARGARIGDARTCVGR